MIKKILLILPAFLLITACTHLTGNDTNTTTDDSKTTEKKETIKIGLVTILTGGLASAGENINNTMTLFLEENPTWGDKEIELIVEDGQCNPTIALNASNKLINQDKVEVIMMDECSGSFLAVAPVANEKEVLLISSLSTSPDITTASGEYGFRNAPNDDKSSDVILEYLGDNFERIALVSEQTDFSQAYRKNVQEKAEGYGLSVVYDEAFNPDTSDFKTMIQKMKGTDAEAVLNVANSGTAAGIFSRQMVELGLELPEFGVDVMASKEYFENAKNAAEGTIIVILSADRSDDRVTNFLQKYEDRFGEEPNFDGYSVLVWDKANILKTAIEEVGYDAEKIKDWLYDMPEYDGLGGEYSFDENGDANTAPILLIAKDGKFVPLEE